MKIAVACRGLVRSPGDNDPNVHNQASVDWCMDNLLILKDLLKEHEVSWYFASWNLPGSIDLTNNIPFDGSVLLRQPTVEEAFSVIPTEPIWFRDPSHYCHRKMGGYGFFCQSKAVMSMIKSTGKTFDHIVATRPDLRIKTSINEWLNSDFNVPGMSYTHFNDHFNVAPTKSMMDVYDQPYDIIDKITEYSKGTEDQVRNLVRYSNHKWIKQLNISEYNLRGFDVLNHYNSGGYNQFKDEE